MRSRTRREEIVFSTEEIVKIFVRKFILIFRIKEKNRN